MITIARQFEPPASDAAVMNAC